MARPDDIQGALFDFDGTLADTEVLGFEFDNVVARQLGVELDDADHASIVGTTGYDSIPAAFARHGVEITFDEFMALRPPNVLIYREVLQDLMPGAADALRDMRARGIRLAMVSTTDVYELVFCCNRFGILSCFDAIVGGDMGYACKPDPEPYRAGLDFLGLPAEKCVAVEDSPAGIAAAKAAGLYTIAFTGGSVVQDVSGADESFSAYAELRL